MHVGAATAAAAGAAAAGAGAPLWLFSYNKENYGFDAGMRFGRFMMARGFANAQVGQYREDIHGITEMTVSKMDAWQTVTTLFLAVGAALSCAGRIGMHGSAPPGWFCALFSGCIFMSVMFNGLSLWLSMHASLRAQCAAVSLLTRKVRLPIPSMGQLDQARVFGSGFEKQEMRDMFRVPFMRHTQDTPDMPPPEDAPGKAPKGKGKAKSSKAAAFDPEHEFASTARDTVPSWVRDEVVVDKAGGFPSRGAEPMREEGESPEHFQLLMKAQEEWRDYDVYARISMLYGVISFLYAVTYYGIGTCISELRGFWVMWSLPMVFIVAQVLILRLDVLKTAGEHLLPNAEWLGHLAPYFAVAACTLEYRFFYSEEQVVITWVLVIVAFFGHFVMALRMLDLAWPSRSPTEMPEEPGKQWWPSSWIVPKAFTKNLWFITPPKKLEDGQNCLVHEMQDMATHGGGVKTCRRRGEAPGRGKHATMESLPADSAEDAGANAGVSPFWEFGSRRAKDLPWRLVRVAICTAAFQWFFMMIASGVEIIMGPESLLKPPGEPPWIRDTKYRTWTPAKVHLSTHGTLPESYRLFAASKARYEDDAEDAHGAGHGADHGAAPAGHGGHGGDHGGDHGAHATTHAPAGDHEVHATPQAHGTTHAPAQHPEGHAGHDAAGHRRLLAAAAANRSDKDAALEELLKAMPLLGELAGRLGGGEAYMAKGDLPQAAAMPAFPAEHTGFMAPGPKVHDVAWPPLFHPRHLACGPTGTVAAALTPRGFGAIVPLGAEAEGAAGAEPFALGGLAGHAPLAGAAWTGLGLRLVTAAGKLLHCAEGARSEGVWPCEEAQHPPLPVPPGTELLSAALADESGAAAAAAGLLVALVFKHLPGMAALYRGTGAGWSPAGEVHLPPGAGPRPGIAFDGPTALLVPGAGGEVHRRPLGGAAAAVAAPHRVASGAAAMAREFPSACALPTGDLLGLALRRDQSSGGESWSPELLAAVPM